MPNWCENTLSIYGPKDEIDKVRAYTKTKRFFNSFFPRPKAIKNLHRKPEETDEQREARKAKIAKKYGVCDRYFRSINNRWTKRDVTNKDIDIIDDEETLLTMWFDTARSPPEWAIAKLAELHDKLTITLKYSEPGMCFSWIIDRALWVRTGVSEYDDTFFGNGKQCNTCNWTYDPDCEDDWSEDEPDRCAYCDKPVASSSPITDFADKIEQE